MPAPAQDQGRGSPQDRGVGPQDQRAAAQDQRSRDLFCRRDAAARTGYVTPGQAASHEQTKGTVGGTLGGAALGAIIGGASGNAGAGAAIGAGAGLLAGTRRRRRQCPPGGQRRPTPTMPRPIMPAWTRPATDQGGLITPMARRRRRPISGHRRPIRSYYGYGPYPYALSLPLSLLWTQL